MSFQVKVQPSGLQYPADEAENLLQSALNAGLNLPYGCRNGSCGACKGRVVEGEVDLGDAPETSLSSAEREEGYALLCCAHPRSDLLLEVREASRNTDFPIVKLPSRVQLIERVADDVIVLKIKLPPSENFRFQAGQYLDFLIAGGRRRSFSIASAPEHAGELELHIRRIPGGEFTGQIFDSLKVRDLLRFEGPLGSFYLREGDKPIVLIAGGTGFAPIKSIVEHMIAAGIRRPVALYWGARDLSGLYLDALARSWEGVLPDFRYVPVLSDSSDASWSGRTGLVHRAVVEDFPDLSAHEVYVCGAPAMVDAARADLAAQCALPEAGFFADTFSFAADSAS